MSDMLRKFVAPEFVFGIGARKQAAKYLMNYGVKKPLLVTDRGVLEAGWGEELLKDLLDKGFEVSVYSNISPNPRDHEVMEGVEKFKEGNHDAIITIGGGSVLDAAKGIGIVVSNGGHILDYEGVDKVPVPMPPLICLPTTGGTSADVSQFAIINDSTNKVKIAIVSKSLVPDVALIDPACLETMDAYLTACTGMDALAHAAEALVSNASSPFTDMHALHAIEIIEKHLKNSTENLHDLELRTEIMKASLLAGLAFSNASLGCVHSLAHSLGGYSDLPHGECNALLLPHVVDYNFPEASERYKMMGRIFKINMDGMNLKEQQKALVDYLINMRKEIGIDGTLEDRGISATDLSTLAGKAIQDPCNATNPRDPKEEDLEMILKETM